MLVVSELHIVYFRHIMRSTYGKITYRRTVRRLLENNIYVTCCIMLYMSYIYVYACVKARDFAGTWDWASEIVEVDPLLL